MIPDGVVAADTLRSSSSPPSWFYGVGGLQQHRVWMLLPVIKESRKNNLVIQYNVISHNKTTNGKEIVLILDNPHKMSPKRCTELIISIKTVQD